MPFSKKILYLSINCSYSHTSLAYGQIYTYTNQKISGWNWEKQEYTTKDNVNEIVCNILSETPDILLSTVYLFNRNFLFEVIKKIKVLHPKIKILLGGPEFLGNNELLLRKNPEINFIFRGDETSLYLFLKNTSTTQPPLNEISGICYIDKNEKYVDNETSIIVNKNLDSLPSPYDKSIIPQNKPFIQVETSRGCFSKCSFCTSSLSKHVAFYSLNRIKSDLTKIRDADYKEIRILDRTFNLPSERACKLLNLFINDFPNLKFHLEFEPHKLTDEVIHILKTSPNGQFHIEAGIQTFHEQSLSSINRNTDLNKTKKMLLKLIQLKNIKIHTDLIFGLPHQTPETIYNDLNLLIEFGPNEIQLEVLKILPGTEIKENNNDSIKYSPIPPYEVLSSPTISTKELLNFSYLSKLIDCYYNITDMQNLIRFAVIEDQNFLKNLLYYTKTTLKAPNKPSFKNRLKLILNYSASTNNKLLEELVIFTAYKLGVFDINKERLKLIKKHELQNIKSKISTNIFYDNSLLLDKPIYLAEFNYNVGDIWNNPSTKIIKNKHFYLFRLSQNGLSKTISRIDLIDNNAV